MLAGTVFVVSSPPLRGQMSEEEKKRLFLESREDIRPVPKPQASPRPKPQPAQTPRPAPESTAPEKKAAPAREEPEEGPSPKPKPSATPQPTPPSKKATPPPEDPAEASAPKSKPSATPGESRKPEVKPSPSPEQEAERKPTPKPTPKPEPSKDVSPKPSGTPDFILLPGEETKPPKPAPSPTPEASPPTAAPAASPAQIPKGKTPEGRALDAPILIEKSGLEKDQGEEPPPKSQFGGLFKRYRYLTPAVRRAIDNARVQRGRWKYIIIHNSGTRQGNARIFDVYHRRVRKMQNGLAYHFVIGNGNSSGNGEVEIGSRWTRQINGGHVASDYLNNIAIGICLVGDLNRDKPTKEQLAAIDELVTYLRSRVGKIKGKQAAVKGHKEINPKPTDCPGDRFPLGWLHQKFR